MRYDSSGYRDKATTKVSDHIRHVQDGITLMGGYMELPVPSLVGINESNFPLVPLSLVRYCLL